MTVVIEESIVTAVSVLLVVTLVTVVTVGTAVTVMTVKKKILPEQQWQIKKIHVFKKH